MRPLSLALVAALAAVFGGCGSDPEPPLRVGVLLPLSGAGDVGWREPLEFARDNINRKGGPAGRPIELVYSDTATGNLDDLAERFLADDSIAAVIGPDSSSAMYDIAGRFVQKKKPLVSPSATAGDIFREFGGKRSVWRTVESDIGQVQTMLLLGSKGGAKDVALIAAADKYGATFFDWFGFFATELGLNVSGIVSYDESDADCGPSVSQALAAKPEVLFVASAQRSAVECIARSARAASPATRLFFSDSAYFPAFITDLGDLAEGLEGTTPAPDPESGFEVAYPIYFGHPPPPYAASSYDALSLVAYGLERSGGQGGEALGAAMAEVVDARGADTGWDRQGVGDALAAIRSGQLPNLRGAASPLDFDRDLHTEPISSTYGHWRIDHGQYVTVEFVSTGESGRATSLASSFASKARMQTLDDSGGYQPGPKVGTWALIAAISTGWGNYRHQADALAQYQTLRSNGVPDDHIVLVLADDLAANAANPEKGVVRNVAGGPNLYANAQIDYRLGQLNAGDLLDILGGKKSASLPTVIESTASDNVYAFFVGHGNPSGMLVGGRNAGQTQQAGETLVLPGDLAATVQTMFSDARYRRLLIAVETCHGGIVGTQLHTPGAVLFAGANPSESSLGANYDDSLKSWVADQFAYQLFTSGSRTPTLTLDALYQNLYQTVSGSHVTVYNSGQFGEMGSVALEEFVK